MTTPAPRVKTWDVMTPRGMYDSPVTAFDLEVAIRAVEARGFKVLEVIDSTIVIAEEG